VTKNWLNTIGKALVTTLTIFSIIYLFFAPLKNNLVTIDLNNTNLSIFEEAVITKLDIIIGFEKLVLSLISIIFYWILMDVLSGGKNG